jgi:hypothetical protein
MHSKTVYGKRLMIIFITVKTNPVDHEMNSNYEVQKTVVIGILNILNICNKKFYKKININL